MMEFEEFVDAAKEQIRDYLPDSFKDAEVEVNKVMKNNGIELTGLGVRREGEQIVPSVYLEPYFEQYEEGTPFTQLMETAAQVTQENRENLPVWNILEDPEACKERITMKLVGAEQNEAYLADKPHTDIEDLAAVYAIVLDESAAGQSSAPITNGMMQMMGMTKEELHEAAVDSLKEKSVFLPLSDLMMGMMEGKSPGEILSSPAQEEPDLFGLPFGEVIPVYVLTNDGGIGGAAQLMNQEIMEDIADRLGGDFVVLPSSVHEVMILPADSGMDRAEMENLVQEVNGEAVSPQEKLSDHVYLYDAKEHELVRMDKAEERRMQKEAPVEGKEKRMEKKEEKSSLMGRISKKQEEIAKKSHEPAHRPAKTQEAVLG